MPEPTPESNSESSPAAIPAIIPEVITKLDVELDVEETSINTQEALPSPLRSLTGAVIAGGFAFGLYKLTQAIATSFATKPLSSTNPLALSISAAVRTLVVGASTLATGIFAIAAFSLVLLALQVAFQPKKTKSIL